MLERNIVANRIKTPDGTILWSRFRHDYVVYKDEKTGETYIVDGGNEYLRCSINEVKAESMTVYEDDPFEVKREVILRGTFDKKGNRIFVPISKLSDGHIDALIKEGNRVPYIVEAAYRKTHGISIPEHDYNKEKIEAITRPQK